MDGCVYVYVDIPIRHVTPASDSLFFFMDGGNGVRNFNFPTISTFFWYPPLFSRCSRCSIRNLKKYNFSGYAAYIQKSNWP